MRAKMFGGALVALALMVTAACGGSQLDPKEVLAANNAVLGNAAANPGSTNPATTNPGTTNPGTTNPGTTNPGTTNPGTTNPGTSNPPAGSGTQAGSCAGFKNGTGITNTTITVGNSSDISGPVPGLFQAAQQGAKAYVAYFNATNPNGICGRKLVLNLYDSRTDAGADQQSTQRICETSFAGLGSLSAFDSGGAATAQSCGLPDVRATSTTAARNNCSTCFGAQATGAYEYSNGIPDYFVKNYHAASQKAAFLFLNAGASAENAKTQIAVETKRGMKFLYTSGIDVAAFNYGPYVQAMKSAGAEYVQFIGGYQQAVRLAQAMQQAGFRPQVIHFDQTTDTSDYIKLGGSAVEGAITSLTYNPLFDSNPELKTYKQWLQQSSPGAVPSGFGLFGWSAGKLFVEEALSLGGRLTRASLVARLGTIHAWTGGGMHGPMDVGSKHTANCVRFEQVKNGKFVSITPRFSCTGITKVSG